ncbi:uncharacterized protein [Sinocyclocheilus grahami]|uniref:uncharacterized protein n=1 Tax=Sinocyclocheilus grahami TaxID=75366 RepID=UPI0007ACAE3B|nr:PREDICTED: uncharacterized protein LOC107571756 [Sinocyclocheilus grahami]
MDSLKPHEDPWTVYKEETPSTTQHFAGWSVRLLESLQSSHLRSLMESIFRQRSQEPIVRVLALSQSPPMRYISVSKRGTLIVWNRHLNNIKPLEMCAGPFNKRQYRKSFQGWTTDAVYLGNVHKIAVATLNRGIHFFDVTTTCSFEQVHLFGLSHVATALCYWYDTEFPNIPLGFTPEHGSFPLLLSLTPDPVLLVTCREYLATLHLHKSESNSRSGIYTSALYNPHLQQVITACADSTLTVWDVKTGLKRMEIRNAHGKEEVSCMALDVHQRRLISAATNGTIKVWNLLNGLNLHKLETVSNAEVTGVICHHDNQLLATGWSRLIAQYSIAFSEDIYVNADLSWKSGRQHGEDILAMDHCPGLGLLATGSYDGEIVIWSLALQKPITRLQTNQQQKAHRPVHRLLFLQRRAQQSHLRSGAVLLSSQNGCVCCWSISGPRHNHGQFYAPDGSDESVMGLSTDQENSLLVTGDTAGVIKVWDISQYALSAADTQSAEDLPSLLHSWRGHERAIVSSELLAYESQLFVLSISVDRRACLWTPQGSCVGCFGQEQQWDLSNPDTYQTNREPTSPIKEEERTEDSQSRVGAGSFICWGESSEVTGTSLSAGDSQQTELALDLQRGRMARPQTPDSERCSSMERFPLPKYSKVLSGEHAFRDLEIKMTAQQRRPRETGREKLCRFGNEFMPLQALELPEISELKDVPLKPWRLKIRQISSRGAEASSRMLSSEAPLHCETLED